MRTIVARASLALIVFGTGLDAAAQTGAAAYYTPLLFNPHHKQWVFRDQGQPRICYEDGRCLAIRFDRMEQGEARAARVESLGHADRAYFLAVTAPSRPDGRTQVFRCTDDSCAEMPLEPGDFHFVMTLPGSERSETRRTAFLHTPASDQPRTTLLLCTDSDCAESAFTRDNQSEFWLLGVARFAGRDRFWLQAAGGEVWSCSRESDAGEPFRCEKTGIFYPEVGSADDAQTVDAIAALFEDAVRRGNLAEAQRLLEEGRSRFPNESLWAQLEQRLAQAYAQRDAHLRTVQARRLLEHARQYATRRDFDAAEALLQHARQLAPDLVELAQVRAEVARLRGERLRALRERRELLAAIEAALDEYRLWTAENLLAEAIRRFPRDPAVREYRARLAHLREREEWRERVRQARELVANARQAMARRQFDSAERHLDEAEKLAPGLPEIREARIALARERIDSEFRADEIRQIVAAIRVALIRKRLDVAERLFESARKRYPSYEWTELQRRLDQAKRDAGRDKARVDRLVAEARAAIQRKDFAAAERAVAEAERLARDAADVKAVRAELDRAKRESERDKARDVRVDRLVAEARAAIQRKDFAAAERAVAEAERLARDAADVKAVRAELDRAKRAAERDKPRDARVARLVAEARAALRRKDLAAAEHAVAAAERLAPDDADVKAVRAELNRAKSNAGPEHRSR